MLPIVALIATILGLIGASNSLHNRVSRMAPLLPSPIMWISSTTTKPDGE